MILLLTSTTALEWVGELLLARISLKHSFMARTQSMVPMLTARASLTMGMLARSASLPKALSAWFVRMSTKNLAQALMAKFGAQWLLLVHPDTPKVAGAWTA